MYLESIRNFSPKDFLSSFTRACFLPGIAYFRVDFKCRFRTRSRMFAFAYRCLGVAWKDAWRPWALIWVCDLMISWHDMMIWLCNIVIRSCNTVIWPWNTVIWSCHIMIWSRNIAVSSCNIVIWSYNFVMRTWNCVIWSCNFVIMKFCDMIMQFCDMIMLWDDHASDR